MEDIFDPIILFYYFRRIFAFLSGLLAESKRHSPQYGLPMILLFICLALSLYKQCDFLFTLSLDQAVRETYWPNPFVESLSIGRYLKEHSKRGDRLVVIGSEPQLYFYSGLRSATGYIYMYSLMENYASVLKHATTDD